MMNMAIVLMALLSSLLITSNCVVSLKVLGQLRCKSTHNALRRCRVPDPPKGVQLDIQIVSDSTYNTCQGGKYALDNFNGRYYIRVHGGCDGLFNIIAKGTPEVVAPPALNGDNCGLANHPSGFRLIGGNDASECEYPWMVKMYNTKYTKFCGSTILDKRHLLTAGHCVEASVAVLVSKASNFQFYAGTSKVGESNKPSSFKAEKVFRHKEYQYNAFEIKNDIAVIRTSRDIKFDRCHRPICLATGNVQHAKNCRSMGWGKTSNDKRTFPEVLQWTTGKVSHVADCLLSYGRYKSRTSFCGSGPGKAGVCHGDSGGPFLCRNETDFKYYQYGIASSVKRFQCGLKPTLFTDVTYYWDWISRIGS